MPTIYDSVADTPSGAIRLEVGSPYEITLSQSELDAAGSFGNPEYDYFEFYADPLTTYTVQVIAANEAIDASLWLPSPTWPGYDTQFGFTAPSGTMVTLENGYSVRNWDPGDRLVTTLVDGGLVRMAVRFDGWSQEYYSGEDFSDLPTAERSFFIRVIEGDVAGTQPQIDTVGTGSDALSVSSEDAAQPITGELEDLDGVADVDDYLFTLRAGFHYDVVVRGTTGAQSGEDLDMFRVTVSEEDGGSATTFESDTDRMSTGDVEQTITSVRIGDGFGDPHLQPGEEVEIRVSVESLFDSDREIGPFHTGGYSVGGFEIEIVPLDDDHGNNRLSPSTIVVGEWQSGTLNPFYEISAAEPFGDRDWMEIVGGVEEGRYYVASFDYADDDPYSMFASFHNSVARETVRAPDFAIWQANYTGAAWLEVDANFVDSADWRVRLGSYETLEIGNGSNQRLVGSSREDFLDGRGGSDRLLGRGGADHLVGDRGNDNLKGGGGHDILNGGAGKDVLKGNGGSDILTGGGGRDKLIGGGGNDTITTGFDGDVVKAGGGIDTIIVAGPDGTKDLKIRGSVDQGDTLDLSALDIDAYFVGDAFVGGGTSSVRTRVDGLGFDIDLDGDGTRDRSILFDSSDDADLIELEGVEISTPETAYEYLVSTLPLLEWLPTQETRTLYGGIRETNPLLSGTNGADFIRGDGRLYFTEAGPFNGIIRAGGGDDVIDIQPELAIEIYGGTGDDYFVWHPGVYSSMSSSRTTWLNDFRQNGEADYIVVREDIWGEGVSLDNISFSRPLLDGDYYEAHIVGTNGLEGTIYVRPRSFPISTSDDYLSDDAFLFV